MSQTIEERSWVAEVKVVLGQFSRSFARTFVLFSLVSVVAAAAAVVVAPAGVWKIAVFALTLLVFDIAGFVMGAYRGIAMTAVVIVKRHGVSMKLLDGVVAVMKKIPSERLSSMSIPSLPLGEVEQGLTQAVDQVLNVPGAKLHQIVLRRVHQALVRQISRITLAEIRKASPTGHIDLDAIKSHLAGKLDGLVEDQLAGRTRRLIIVLLVIGTILAPAAAYGLRRATPSPGLENKLHLDTRVER